MPASWEVVAWPGFHHSDIWQFCYHVTLHEGFMWRNLCCLPELSVRYRNIEVSHCHLVYQKATKLGSWFGSYTYLTGACNIHIYIYRHMEKYPKKRLDLGQDLPNYIQANLPIHSLPQEIEMQGFRDVDKSDRFLWHFQAGKEAFSKWIEWHSCAMLCSVLYLSKDQKGFWGLRRVRLSQILRKRLKRQKLKHFGRSVWSTWLWLYISSWFWYGTKGYNPQFLIF